MACAPSEDSDQHGHTPSLIRGFAVRMKKALVPSYPLSTKRRLWSDWADAQADLSLRWAHISFVGFVMRWLKYLSDVNEINRRETLLSVANWVLKTSFKWSVCLRTISAVSKFKIQCLTIIADGFYEIAEKTHIITLYNVLQFMITVKIRKNSDTRKKMRLRTLTWTVWYKCDWRCRQNGKQWRLWSVCSRSSMFSKTWLSEYSWSLRYGMC